MVTFRPASHRRAEAAQDSWLRLLDLALADIDEIKHEVLTCVAEVKLSGGQDRRIGQEKRRDQARKNLLSASASLVGRARDAQKISEAVFVMHELPILPDLQDRVDLPLPAVEQVSSVEVVEVPSEGRDLGDRNAVVDEDLDGAASRDPLAVAAVGVEEARPVGNCSRQSRDDAQGLQARIQLDTVNDQVHAFENAELLHDSSSSVGGASATTDAGCGDPHPTEEEPPTDIADRAYIEGIAARDAALAGTSGTDDAAHAGS